MEQQNLLEEVLAEIDYNFGDDKALQDNDQGYQLKHNKNKNNGTQHKMLITLNYWGENNECTYEKESF